MLFLAWLLHNIVDVVFRNIPYLYNNMYRGR